ncbi:hypothetical protein COZ13_01910 [Candidatus Desantisbacteria bacterium CG_4_10_14_3_um_filter_40_18]|uniref:Abortive phage infection protein C-terminal domain-containing protein n=2 Tax=unclassified Candidatus Desantisiibacteriota TaxID=3106372 RepID=A0A2M7P3Z5_9BACT|nr:MAG: hypothetical protein COX18_09340 [Candidatus Desantisbacteria bacterium CG23_combo_of_CG06-09_8_20_14_all_40_23]PIY20089.1 MAG: hypothetical protein COZ13_01910 [Candidatus Desantisbacteria bacterium CG_4_10_14_3_um_filter_40_18]
MSILQSVLKANLDNLNPYLPEDKKNSDSFAFLVFAITSILDITINEAILCSTEGSGDGGIDAIYIDETENNIIIHIFQTKYRTNFNKSIGKNEIDLTIAKVEEIFQGYTVENQSPIIASRIEEIRDIIQEKSDLKMPEIYLYFAVNTSTPNEADKERARQLEEKGNYTVLFYDSNDLLQAAADKSKKDCKINVTTHKNILYLDADEKLGDVRGIVATISAQQLINIYKTGGWDRVLSRNIRYFLGNNKINKKIKQTASNIEEAKYFWFLNNGVTITCDKFSFTDDARGNKIISVSNPKIINGGQTTKSLYHVSKEIPLSPNNLLNEVYLLIRLYETDNEELIDKITEGTNNQNPIFERELKANHPIQLLVKKYFLEKGYYYETHRKEYTDKKIDKDKIANNERVFQSYVSLFKDIPHEAKSSKSKIFERYFDDVFDNGNDNLPQQLLISHKLLTFIEEQAKKYSNEWKNEDVFLNHAELAMVYIVGKIYPKIKTDETIFNNITSLKRIYAFAILLLRIFIEYEKKRDMDYSHNKFFKSRDFTVVIKKIHFEEYISFIESSVIQNDPLTNIVPEAIIELCNLPSEKIAVFYEEIRRHYGIQEFA